MGRALQKSTAPRRLAVVAALATGLGLVAAGCSAGQVTQTDTQVAAVNGASGQVGDVAVRDAQFPFPVAHGSFEEGDDAPITLVIANNGLTADRLIGVTSDSSSPAEITGDTELEPTSAVIGQADEDAGSHASTTGRPSGSASASVSTTTTPSAPGSATSGSAATTTGSASTAGSATTTTGSGTSISAPPTTATKLPSSVDPSEPGVVRIVLKNLKKPLRPGETIRVTFLFEKAGELTLDLPIGATTEPRQDAPAEH
ncbi:hypothetical protein [Saccharothrix sp. HUAS TT1]|uniref:hypothetical protein n=1 Tax=unclassified Saccharothrix TaxID=2593673 RepID=UPI00345BF368